jgi:hypothetical protein
VHSEPSQPNFDLTRRYGVFLGDRGRGARNRPLEKEAGGGDRGTDAQNGKKPGLGGYWVEAQNGGRA